MKEKIDIRGVLFDDISEKDAVAVCRDSLENRIQRVIHTPNTEIVQACLKDPALFPVINGADLIIPDGVGVIYAGKILGKPFSNGRLPGIELCKSVVRVCGEIGKSVFLLGGKPGVAEKAAGKLKEEFPSLQICGYRDGYFNADGEENRAVLKQIETSNADFLIVCLGAPKQETWMAKNRASLPGVSLMGGFGGSIDVFAGDAKRAPDFFCRHGLEWFYRLIRQPSRIGRMAKLPAFLCGTVFERLKKKK